MLNFRKLKKDFSSAILSDGKKLYDKKSILSAKIIKFDQELLRISAKIAGFFENTYESEIEIDRFESQTVHCNCDCSYRFDCQHIAALIYYLEDHLDHLLVNYSKESDFDQKSVDKTLIETLKEAETKEVAKKDKAYQKYVLDEYISSSKLLSSAPFFLPIENIEITKAELALIINPKSLTFENKGKMVDFQLALRLPFRSKPLQIPFIKQFFHSLRYLEPIHFASKKYFFSLNSFDEIGRKIIELLMNNSIYNDDEDKNDRAQRIAHIDFETFGMLLANAYDAMSEKRGFTSYKEDLPLMPYVFIGTIETPLQCSFSNASFKFELEYIDPPASKLLLKPTIMVDQNTLNIHEAIFFESLSPGVIYQEVYYRFAPHIKRIHLQSLISIRDMTIPQPLFGTFVENALPELKRYAEIANETLIDKFVTIPFTEELKGRCALSYVDGELEATLFFTYEGIEVHSIAENLSYDEINGFVTENGVLARRLVEERKIIEELFQDFIFNPETGTYFAKTEKKIVEFMTEVLPRFKRNINFECPQNLLDQFIYDKTTFTLTLDYKDKIGYYNVDLKVNGDLKGVSLDRLWECMTSNRSFIELSTKKQSKDSSLFSKILVLDLSRLSKLIKIFDEIGLKKLDNLSENRPLWSLVNINEESFSGLPIKFSISDKLKDIRLQMLGEKSFEASEIPSFVDINFRSYQKEGIHWLERLRHMYLNGILADDMGLGKTLQAIVAITQYHLSNKETTSLVVCPTSLLHNWKEEFHKFNPKLRVLIVDGIPSQRKKVLAKISDYDVLITSYTLMQKDIEQYQLIHFGYVILDEAQHIKNRGTRNAKSAKLVQSAHKLILTGTPIENSLDELWSLFDFLMPGLLSSYDRFVENYIRVSGDELNSNIEYLKTKVSPFILRRMKVDVLKDLPPVDEITYRCQLAGEQLDLYRSYAQSAKEQLSQLVEKEGFDKVQIHVLATLTRLKQICCHPAIFAKEKAEVGDSAKYEMLLELLQTLVEGKHKTVIFSQYTKMLQIMREDFEQRGIKFSYLDGSTKNRLQIVKDFNENEDIPVFLVSLKAGGTGLNITGADTVVHYDMWWNPAVENQATDRVHRIGQNKSVSCYKLVTLNSIEEKIVELQNRKKGLVKKVVSCDDEAISKLTWEDVLELLQI